MDYLRWPDYLILVSFLAISLGIGVYHALTGGRQKTTTEFIMANRSLQVLPTALSLLITFQSAIMILGMTAEMYSYGTMYLIWTPVTITVAIFLTMQVSVPWLYPLKLVSVNEYLERRFRSKSVRMLASVTNIFFVIIIMGAAMYAPAIALQSVTGLSIMFSIPVMAVVTIVYTALGGMRAVIWTDVFQTVIIVGGLLAVLIKGLVVLGGFDNALQLCSQTGRLNWADFSPDPTVRHTFWGFLIGFSTGWFGVYSLSQSAVQRLSATKTLQQAKLTIFLNLPSYIVLHFIICFTGLVVVSYYTSTGCDPLLNHEISNANELLPHFVLQIFADNPGFAGLFLAALYGGTLSTISSYLSGTAANCWEDILQWKLMHWTESRKALLNRFLVVFLGVAGTGCAFIASAFPGPITQVAMALNGAFSGPVYGMFLLGGLNRYANWKGALIGATTSLVGSLWLTIGSYTMRRGHPTFPPLSTDGCTKPNNLTFPQYDNANSSSVFLFLDESPVNATMSYFRPLTNQTPAEVPLQGLERIYSISYLWYQLIWIVCTIAVGSLASFLLRDRSEEEQVDEELLINLRRCFQCKSISESASKVLSLINYKTEVELQPEETEMTKEPREKFSKLTAKETPEASSHVKEVTNGEKAMSLTTTSRPTEIS